MESRLDRRKPSLQIRLSKKIVFFSTKTKLFISGLILFGLFIALNQDLSYSAKISLYLFIIAMVLWVSTSLPAGFVALSALMTIVLLKGADTSLLYESFSEEVVWLMIGSFIIGEAVRSSGLASRFTHLILKKAHEPLKLLTFLTIALQPLVFFIPSTSGRAALSLPIVKELNRLFQTERQQKTIAMLVPIMILMGSSATLIGAGSHIIGIGLLNTSTGESISYFNWFIWGMPFVLVISVLTLFIMRYMFWSYEPLLSDSFSTNVEEKSVVLHDTEKKTLWMIALLIVFWMTENVHGYDIGFITMIGGLLFMVPKYGVITWKQGIKSISWNLIVFVAAATALGKGLIETGVVDWLQEYLFRHLDFLTEAPSFIILLVILLVSVTSHLYITSHTTRAVMMIPGFIVLSETFGLDSSTVVFLSLVGMNYCVTFPVSSKALLLYYEDDRVSYDAKDLLKLSCVLMPLYIVVMVIFYYTYWRWTGLTL